MNKKNFISLALIISFFNLFGQELETIKTYYDYSKTKLASKYTVIKDTPTKHGKMESWDENGNLDGINYYKNNKLDGTQKAYYNGKIREESNYKDGVLNGLSTSYTYSLDYEILDNPIVTKTLYKDGKKLDQEEIISKVESSKFWFKEDGRSIYKIEKTFPPDGKHGIYNSFDWAIEYYPSGELYREFECCELKYKTDTPKPCGILRTYYISGNLMKYIIFDKFQKQWVYKEFDDISAEDTINLKSKRHSLLFISENDLFQYLLTEDAIPSKVTIPHILNDLTYEEKVFYDVMIDAPDYVFERLIEKFANATWADKDRINAIINMAKSTDKKELDKIKSNSFVTIESYPNGQPKKIYKGSDFKEYKGTRKCIEYFENGNISSKYSEVYLKIDYSGNDIHKYDSIIYYYPNGKIKSIGFYKFEKECPKNYSSDYYYEKDGVWKYYNEDGTMKEAELYKQLKILSENRICGYFFKTDSTSMNTTEYLTFLKKEKKEDFKQLFSKDKTLKNDISLFIDNLSTINTTKNINVLINFYEKLNEFNRLPAIELNDKIHGKSDDEIITNLNLSF